MRTQHSVNTGRHILATLTLAVYATVLVWSFAGHQHLLSEVLTHRTPISAEITQTATDAHDGHDPASCPICAFARGSNARIANASPPIEAVQASTPVNPCVTTAPRVPFAATANPRAPPTA